MTKSFHPAGAKEAPGKTPKGSHGFQIGKARRGGSGVYLGKAEKIKRTLIHKAKLKKQRARELARAGYAPGSSGQPSNGASDDEGDPMHNLEDEMDEDVAPPRRTASKGKRRASRNDDVMPADLDDLDAVRKRPSKRPPSPSSSDDDQPPVAGPSSRAEPNAMIISPPAKGRSNQPPASRKQPLKRRRLSEAGEDEAAVATARATAKKRCETSKDAWKSRNRNGQPKLGKRIGAMLGKIQAAMK